MVAALCKRAGVKTIATEMSTGASGPSRSSIHPLQRFSGPCQTDALFCHRITGAKDSDWMSVWKSRTPMGRFAQPKEIADMLVMLASNQASYCCGSDLVVDGGCALSYSPIRRILLISTQQTPRINPIKWFARSF